MKLVLFLSMILFIFGCANKTSTADGADFTETAQQIGDVMASIDEMGTSSGSIASTDKSTERIFARLAPNNSGELTKKNIVKLFQPEAQATTCTGLGFGTCGTPTANTIARTFPTDCTVGSAKFNGSVTLAWSGASAASCVMQASNDYITRSPNFNVTGRRNAVLSVSNVGTYGQKLTWVSGSGTTRVVALTSDGINRKFITSAGITLFNHTTQIVTGPSTQLTVTGTTRASRVINGGVLTVTDNQANTTCSFTPVSVTWGPSCNCPVSGTWNGSCSTGTSSKLVLTGCGTGTYTDGTNVSSVTLDRCGT